MLAGLKKKSKIREESKSPKWGNSPVEIQKEKEDCPNCHFSMLKRINDEVVYPICGYGHKRCG
ncbi:MAG TPA: hypothetical protein VMT04_05605 [Terriglobales bacterium]|nr:hypothetical protein [Terriglobales bacterium]